jgi:hypothetical protein
MGVELYKKGSSKNIRGFNVDSQVFDEYLFEPNLGAGWFLTPEEAYGEVEEVIEAPVDEEQAEYVEEEEEIEQPEFKEVDTNGSGKLSNKEIRAAAQNMGIEDYDTARIATLKEKMGL